MDKDKRTSKTKFLIVGGSIGVFIILALSIFLISRNNTDKTVKEYSELLINGNYSDILDLAYFPNSEFITEEKINELKEYYFNETADENSNIIDCTFVKSEENDDMILYKLTLETTDGQETDTLKLQKKENKLLLDGLYDKKTITVNSGSTVYLDDIQISSTPEKSMQDGSSVDIYNVTLLNNVSYNLKITHPFFKDIETIYDEEENYIGSNGDLKEDYYTSLQTEVNNMIIDITTTAMQNGNTNDLNKYFLNNNAEDFIKDNGLSELITEEAGFNKVFKEADGTNIYTVKYIDNDKFSVYMAVSCKIEVSSSNGNQSYKITDGKLEMVDSYESDGGCQLLITCTEKDGKWLISDWSTDFSGE